MNFLVCLNKLGLKLAGWAPEQFFSFSLRRNIGFSLGKKIAQELRWPILYWFLIEFRLKPKENCPRAQLANFQFISCWISIKNLRKLLRSSAGKFSIDFWSNSYWKPKKIAQEITWQILLWFLLEFLMKNRKIAQELTRPIFAQVCSNITEN